MKKVLRWTIILSGGACGLLAVGLLLLIPVGQGKLGQTYQNIPTETVSIPTGADAVARGDHLAAIWMCKTCHGDNLAGRPSISLNSETDLLGSVPAPNLTRGQGGVGTEYTDADWVRAIRHGVTPDGHATVGMYNFWSLSDQDLGDLIAYIKQAPPVDASYPDQAAGAGYAMLVGAGVEQPAASAIDHTAARPAAVPAGQTAEYGGYLFNICLSCHSAKFPATAGQMSKDDFIRAIRQGTDPKGKPLMEAMRTGNFAALTDDEVEAMWLYAQSVKAPAK